MTVYRHPITLESPTTTRDGAGQRVQTFVHVQDLRADIKHQSGVSVVRANAESSTVRASIRIRWQALLAAQIQPGWRVWHGSLAYNVKESLPDPGHKHIDLVCEIVR